MFLLKISKNGQTLSLPHRRGNTADDGFNLIELVAVVAVLAILSAIAIPKYTQLIQDAKVARGKDLLTNILEECMFVRIRKGTATAGDLRMTGYGTKNAPGGHRLGIDWGHARNTWGGYVLDTDLNSQIKLEPHHSCLQVAAKARWTHFMIKYNTITNKVERDCRIDPEETMYQTYHCDPTKPAGEHW